MKETIKKIMLAVFFVAGLILPQYSDEFKAMETDPAFISAVVFIVTMVLAWFDETPKQVISKLKKKDVK